MEQLPPIIHKSWHEHLQPLFNDPKMIMLRDKILTPNSYFPERKDIFRVFEMPLGDIRVVILGQDPYPNGEGIGLAFAVKWPVKMPSSLKIIKGEVERSELVYHKKHEDYGWKTLEHWVEQDVFLLNTALTVKQKEAGSHLNYWLWFTREVIKIISKHKPCIWMLWGSKAKGFSQDIFNNAIIREDAVTPLGAMSEAIIADNPNTNYILVADHPAAETYPGSKYKFSGCNHFNLCNAIFAAKKEPLIKW